METLTVYNVAEFTGEWVKNHPSKKMAIIISAVYITAFMLLYVLLRSTFGEIIFRFVLPLSFLAVFILVISIGKIYKFIGKNNRDWQIKFVQSKISQLKNNPVLCEPEDKMLQQIREEVSAEMLIISTYSITSLSHLFEIQSEILNEFDDRVEDQAMIYFAEKKRIVQELNTLENLLRKLTKKN